MPDPSDVSKGTPMQDVEVVFDRFPRRLPKAKIEIKQDPVDPEKFKKISKDWVAPSLLDAFVNDIQDHLLCTTSSSTQYGHDGSNKNSASNDRRLVRLDRAQDGCGL